MISEYIRELKRYTYNELKKIFKCNNQILNSSISKLKEYGILKVVPYTKEQKDLSELNNEDIEIASIVDNDYNHYFVFDYVGIISINGIVLKIYPKYIKKDNSPKKQMKQVLKVIDKFNKQEQIIKIFNDSDYSTSYNNLAVCLYFLNDYYENGLYNNELDILEENGSGEIYWDKTINEAFTLISDGCPYYPSVYTKKRINDEYSFFKKLHETIVTKCSNELDEADLLDLFDITQTYLSETELEEFGDTDYILYRLENEMNIQFNTRKNNLLKMMYAYIANKGTLNELEHLSMYGTKSFNLVWEKVCAKVLNNHLDVYLCNLPLNNNPYKKSDGKLIDVIEKPKWVNKDENGQFIHETATLIPDTIVISNNKMIIYDAKYYYFEHTRQNLKGQPGIESITKQYLYQLAYKKFTEDNKISNIENYFIIPTETDTINYSGFVTFPILKNIGLENIKICLISAKYMFKNYLDNQIIEINQ